MRSFPRLLGWSCALLLTSPALAEDAVTITLAPAPPPKIAPETPETSPLPTEIVVESGSKVVVKIVPAAPDLAPAFVGQRPTVDVAILLDTSNSMDGLIDQAKRQLWTIVGQFAEAKKRGQTPHLRVALFEYGNSRLPATEGYLRQVVPLTDDLDALSAALFMLTTNGGDEYCGQVINEAVTRLDWSSEPGGYKAIFIAGNEPFNQGGVDYRESCKRAIELGIVVNTIHCGDYEAGMAGQWNLGAQLAEGQYFNIDQDRVAVEIESPYDTVIIELNTKLNKTYLWYGQGGGGYGVNQLAQDKNSLGLSSGVALQRIKAKSTSVYNNTGRDLVDSVAADDEALAEADDAFLPEEMKAMDPEQRAAYVEEKAQQRAAIQKQIAEASAKREAFVAEEKKNRAEETGEATLGDAVTQAVQQQLRDAGYDAPSSE